LPRCSQPQQAPPPPSCICSVAHNREAGRNPLAAHTRDLLRGPNNTPHMGRGHCKHTFHRTPKGARALHAQFWRGPASLEAAAQAASPPDSTLTRCPAEIGSTLQRLAPGEGAGTTARGLVWGAGSSATPPASQQLHKPCTVKRPTQLHGWGALTNSRASGCGKLARQLSWDPSWQAMHASHSTPLKPFSSAMCSFPLTMAPAAQKHVVSTATIVQKITDQHVAGG
jgi:hypothetical protein